MKSFLTIVSLGPGDPDLLNMRTVNAIRNAEKLILRTGRHPVASWLEKEKIPYTTLDRFYTGSDDFDLLNRNIAEYLQEQASDAMVVYAVPDVASDHTVRSVLRLISDPDQVMLIPGTGSFDHVVSSSAALLDDGPVLITSASDFLSSGYYDPNQTALITELDNPILAGQVKIMLSKVLEDEHEVFLICGSLFPVSIPLFQLDRQPHIDHTSSLLIRGSGILSRNRFVMRDLATLMERLRAPDGCPWDRVQTHETLRPYIVEEAWECVTSIDQDDPDHLCEELGDLLFQIVFHASVGASYDEFTLEDVITGICCKMIRRHPHVFRNCELTDRIIDSASWEKIKCEETGHTKLTESLDDVSPGFPALKYASKILKKINCANRLKRAPADIIREIYCVSRDLSQDPAKIGQRDLGHLLLLGSELCLCLGADSELILHETADRLKNDIKKAEILIHKDGKSLEHLTFDELGVYLKHVEGEIE